MAERRLLKVTTFRQFTYDPERVQAIYDEIAPDPDHFGDEPVYAVWAYLSESLYGGDVFDERDFDQGFEDEAYDPEA